MTCDRSACGQELVKRAPAFMYCLVADENVYNLYGKTFEEKFRATGKTLFVKVTRPKLHMPNPKPLTPTPHP